MSELTQYHGQDEHRCQLWEKNADCLQFGPCKDTEEMVELERLGGKDREFQRD